MYKTVMTFTRPSTDIPFWQPSANNILHNQENYGFIRNRSISEDGLVLTLETYSPSEEIWNQYKAEAESGNQEAAEARKAYNDEHGIVRQWIFKGNVDE